MMRHRLSPILINTLLVAAIGQRALAIGHRVPAKDRIVVVVSIDGMPARVWDDPKLPVPTLRRLAREGVQAKAMTVSNPSVTWPCHTSMVTGVTAARHGVLFNGLPVRMGDRRPVNVEPWRNKDELVQAATVYDLAYKSGLTTAQVDWVAIYDAPTITWAFPEIPNVDGEIEREMIAAGTITKDEISKFRKGSTVWQDRVWTDAAVHIIRNHKPNLLLFHVLNTDALNHKYGPESPASYTAYAYADVCVQELLEALQAAGLQDRATLLVVSDHGFQTVKRAVRPNAILRSHGLLTGQGGKIECDAYAYAEGGTALVYITNSRLKGRLSKELKEIFVNTEGVRRVLSSNDFPVWGMPEPQTNDRMADLVLAAEDGYAFHGGDDGPGVIDVGEALNKGTHGYLSSNAKMNAVFLAWGYGIRPASRLGIISNLDVAPTIAALLGIRLAGTQGKELREILSIAAGKP